MSAFYDRVREVFHDVVELDPDERIGVLETRCGSDTELRAEVERLLGSLDEANTIGAKITDELAGDLIAPKIDGYTITRVLGEGGMGTVYEARQHNPERRVSIKVIRFGSRGAQMGKRFEREVQVLARLQHPGIAQIYATGSSTIAGRTFPYIALEYVEGRSLLEYADQAVLDTRRKLELAVKLCDAIEHAHTKGIVHRDIKPANILVTPAGQPKVLDFGIARLTDSDVQAVTLQTEAGQILGTASYMSPEQATGNPDAIDHRSDVYSLGVVIYELLTGRRPHEIDHLPIPDAVLAIREQEPTRIGAVDSHYRGDIDTILAKSLDREPDRRYQTARQLGEDIERHLRSEPIYARPTSRLYRARKFSRRNKALVAGTSVAFLALLAGLAGTSVALNKEANARRETATALSHAQSSVDFLENVLLGLSAGTAQGRDTELIRALLDDAEASVNDIEFPMVGAEMMLVIGRAYFAIHEYATAAAVLREASSLLAGHGPEGEALRVSVDFVLADSIRNDGDLEAAMVIFDDLTPRARMFGDADIHISTHIVNAECHMGVGLWQEALSLLEEARIIRVEAGVIDHPGLDTMYGMMLRRFRRYDEAEKMYRIALDVHIKRDDKIQIAQIQHAMAKLANDMGDLGLAEQLYRDAIANRLEIDDRSNPSTAIGTGNLGRLLASQGRYDEAMPFLQTSIDMHRELYGDDYFGTAFPMSALAQVASGQGDHAGALEINTTVLATFERQFGTSHPTIVTTLSDRGKYLSLLDRHEEADGNFVRAAEIVIERGLPLIVFEEPIRLLQSRNFESMGDIISAIAVLEDLATRLDPDALVESEIQHRIKVLRQVE